MTVKHLLTVGANRHAGKRLCGGIAGGALAMLLLVPGAPYAASSAETKSGEKSVSFESIAGSKVKRIILSEKAVQRLGIETSPIGEEVIALKQIVGGVYVMASSIAPVQTVARGSLGPFASLRSPFAVQLEQLKPSKPDTVPAAQVSAAPLPARAAGENLVRVMFSPAEWERLAKDRPVRVFKLGPRGKRDAVVTARPSGGPPLQDFKRSMLMYFFTVNGTDHGLTQNERVRVELQLTDSGKKQKVVPHGAVYYDAQGGAWVYVNPKPLVYERRQIKVERIIGDKAVLAQGPDLGASVVTVGAALLYGTEIYGK